MDWQTLRNQFMRTIGGDPPGAQLEDQLIQAYTEHPEAVERSIEKIGLAFTAGKIRSPWGALKHEVAKASEAARNPHHDKGASRQRAIQRAEQWIRNAGMHHDRISEIEHALFGNAQLEPTLDKTGRRIVSAGETLIAAPSPELRQKLVDAWHELRPIGEQLEQDAIDRGLRYQEQRAELAQAKRVIRNIGNLAPNDSGATEKETT